MRLQNLSGCILLLCILLSIFSIGQGTQIDKDITNALATNIVDRVNCSTTSDCIQHGLTSSICQHSICVSKNLFPLSIAEILSSMAAFLSVILAAGVLFLCARKSGQILTVFYRCCRFWTRWRWITRSGIYTNA